MRTVEVRLLEIARGLIQVRVGGLEMPKDAEKLRQTRNPTKTSSLA
jgi:hypothetical protein